MSAEPRHPMVVLTDIRCTTDAILATRAALPQTKADGAVALQKLRQKRQALQAELPPLRLVADTGGAA